MACCNISDLKLGKELRYFQARIFRAWNVTLKDKVTNINMVLIDAQGQKIQAIINDQDAMKKHKKFIEENNIIQLSRFNVGPVLGQHRPTTHQFRIIINFGTRIELCHSNLPNGNFDFVPFEQIKTQDNPETYLRGVVKDHGLLEPYQFEGNVVFRLVITLIDERNNTLPLVFFKDHSEAVYEFLIGPTHPKIIALNLAKVSNFKGFISASTYWNATKIFFNPSIAETTMLMESSVSQIPTMAMSSSQLTTGSQSSSAVVLNNPDLPKSIIEIKKTLQRFKVQMRVNDGTADACFTLFDKEAFRLLHKSANELKEELIKENDEYGFPKILDTLLLKKFAFVVDVNQHFNIEKGLDNYTVVTIALNENLISDIEASQSVMEDSNSTNYQLEGVDPRTPMSIVSKKKKKIVDFGDPECIGIDDLQTPQLSTSKAKKPMKREKND
ncbi:hypothetical protein RIF29_04328 [Crotalaria pallida]|uniref:Uncharacterized protein n=1 Tax=Crotalaria pallida TaxID=3830 RepID=A0AAN9J0W5_CROPI